MSHEIGLLIFGFVVGAAIGALVGRYLRRTRAHRAYELLDGGGKRLRKGDDL